MELHKSRVHVRFTKIIPIPLILNQPSGTMCRKPVGKVAESLRYLWQRSIGLGEWQGIIKYQLNGKLLVRKMIGLFKK